MDDYKDTAKLVAELQDKLAELDGKVAAYRRDMVEEFRKHMAEALSGCPEQVSNEVEKAIADSMANYPALFPTDSACDSKNQSAASSPTSEPVDKPAGRKSPPPVLPHTSGVPKDGPRSPHEREREFQGLFTPRYLPLLDGSHHGPQSPPASPLPATNAPFPLSMDNIKKVDELKERKVMLEIRPTPVRRLTDRSTSSVESSTSGSESKMRRSALRRTSSSNKGSPRRVRFEFDGEEVLPSSSPGDSSAILLLPESGADGVTKDESETRLREADVAIDDSPAEYIGTSLLDVEGEEDLLPRPKKVSSTQALQALTRSPLDAGTIWTVVNPDPVEPAAPKMNGGTEEPGSAQPIAAHSQPQLQPQPQANHHGLQQTAARVDVIEVKKKVTMADPKPSMREVHNDREDDHESESDDEFLSMRPKSALKPKAGTRAVSSIHPRKPSLKGSVRIADPPAVDFRDPPAKAQFDEEDPFFGGFEDESRDPQRKYLDNDEDEDDDRLARERRLRALSLASNEPTPPLDPQASGQLPPVSPSAAAMLSHSIGSYKGNPMKISVINNPQLYEEIASMKDVHFFVGSVDGRSGADAADIGSYRAASLRKHDNQVGATPRSFTERLAIEEAMERRGFTGDED